VSRSPPNPSTLQGGRRQVTRQERERRRGGGRAVAVSGKGQAGAEAVGWPREGRKKADTEVRGRAHPHLLHRQEGGVCRQGGER